MYYEALAIWFASLILFIFAVIAVVVGIWYAVDFLHSVYEKMGRN